MKTLDLAPHHPIQLSAVNYLEFGFERLDLRGEGPYYFPEFDITVKESRVREDGNGVLVFSVKSNANIPDYVKRFIEERQEKEPTPSINFHVTAFVQFICVSDNAREYFPGFMENETPILISWPYLRGFIADMVQRSGLPDYHLPLLQIGSGQPNVESKNLEVE